MNLWNCRIAYFVVSDRLLDLSAKTPLLSALMVYRAGNTETLTEIPLTLSRYQERKHKETRWELARTGIVSETMDLLPIPLENRIVLPSDCEYSPLSYGALKTLLACYSRSRHSRESFRFVAKQSQLARDAGISERKLRDALKTLEDRNLIQTEKIWKQGTRITLLDPEFPSGCPLWYLGEHYQRRMDGIPVHDKYKTCLASYDPRRTIESSRGPLVNYPVHCPFCKHKSRKPTMRINTAEDNDFWYCFVCKRKGNSDRMWAKMQWRIGKADWRQDLQDVASSTESVIETGHEKENQ